ncbi:MAG TPA: IclR family transcriptional regulator [Hydrogenophaga sp.]
MPVSDVNPAPTHTKARPRTAEPDGQAGEANARAGIQSVEVGFVLLDALSQASGALMLRDLAAAAGMSAAKAHRYLVSFQRMGLVIQDPVSTRYDLGPAALRLGLASLSRISAVKLARERMPALLAQTGHVLAIAVWGNQGPTMVHWEEAVQTVPVTLRLGDVMPLLTSATGRCFAAFMGTEGRDAQRLGPMIKAELARFKKLPTDGLPLVDVPQTPQAVQAVLDETRAHGIARVVHSLLPGVGGFCAPVFDAQGRLALGLVVLGSVATLDTAWNSAPARALLACAQQLSRDLGHTASV